MANPKFSVGEVVILQSGDHAYLNGEHTVIAVVEGGERYQGWLSADPPGVFGYDLGVIARDDGHRGSLFGLRDQSASATSPASCHTIN